MSSSKIEEVGEARRSMNAVEGLWVSVVGGFFVTNWGIFVLLFFCQKLRHKNISGVLQTVNHKHP